MPLLIDRRAPRPDPGDAGRGVLFWDANTRVRFLHAGFAEIEVHHGLLRASHPKASSPASITVA